ncbi:MAG: hypothetical protein NZM04_07975, partial [Methylacidiphilales bacterium]|nr:hypothetical protein [Candidatus Methylacidiphilales bacterium]
MKRAIKKIIRMLVANDRMWTLAERSVLKVARYAEWSRQLVKEGHPGREKPEEISRPVFSGNRVRHGPFAGMVYENDTFCCSAIAPKLLGSYEREIQPWIESLLLDRWEGVVDVGCAEGYYAVGFACKI